MIIRKADDMPAEEVRMPGAKDVRIRLLVHEAEGAPNFYMRQFTFAPGGHTPDHTHPWEHEMYVLAGEGVARTPDGERPIAAGDCIYVAPGDRHQFRNTSDGEMKIICLVPKV